MNETMSSTCRASLSTRVLENAILNLKEYRTGARVLTSLPRYVLVELTRGCNLACPMCRSSKVSVAGTSMPSEILRKVEEQLFPTAELIDLRGWGESLILNDFPRILHRAATLASAIRVVSNLSFRCPDALKELCHARAYVAVSIDSANDQTLQQLRRGANARLIRSNLKQLADNYYERWRSTERLCIQATLQRPACTDLFRLAELASDCGISEIRLSAVSVSHNSPLSLRGHVTQVDEAVGRLVDRAGQLEVRVIGLTALGSLGVAPRNAPCFHPWGYACVTYDGRVGYCDHLIGPHFDDLLLGDLNKQSFVQIWNSPAWQHLRAVHTSDYPSCRGQFPKCESCYSFRNTDLEPHFVLGETHVVLTKGVSEGLHPG